MRRTALLASLTAALLGSAWGRADALDPRRAHALAVGKPPALAACPGLDAAASRRSSVALPSNPVATVVRLPRGVRHTPASDASGHLLIAQDDGRLSELDEQGRPRWSASTDSEIVSAPIITSDGSRVVLTRGGELRAFDERGAARCQRSLPGIDAQRETLVVPTPAGGVLLANGATLFVLGAGCALERQAHTPDRVAAVLAAPQALLAALDDGSLWRAPAVGGFQRVARFGGKLTSATLRNSELLALVDQHALTRVELVDFGTSQLALEPGLTLVGSPALLPGGGVVLATDDDLLSIRAADGHEALRVALNPGRGNQRPRAPHLLTDPSGRLLVVQSTREALLVAADGKLSTVEGSACSEPFAPVPVGAGRVAIACRSGTLFYLGEKSP